MTTDAIVTEALTKRFGDTLAVDGLDIAVPAGSVFGFLGPNGSGKTTTIRMLLGLIRPTSGSAGLLGRPMPKAARTVLPHVGALIEGPAFYPYLSGRDNLVRLDVVGRRIADTPGRVTSALERVGLTAAAGKKYRAYSLGMRQRLGLAAVLLRRRELIVLDEPTNGLDPQGTREIRALIRELATEGTTVFLSSHLLAEVEQICTHAAVLRLGRCVAQGTLGDLRATNRPALRVETPDVALAVATLSSMEGLGRVASEETVVTAPLDSTTPEDCCAALVHAGVRVRSLTAELPSLEDTFVALTGSGFDVS